MAKINVENAEITVIRQNEDDFISLTDMARSQLQEHIIFRWLSLKSTIEYLGEWEMLYNPDLKGNIRDYATINQLRTKLPSSRCRFLRMLMTGDC